MIHTFHVWIGNELILQNWLIIYSTISIYFGKDHVSKWASYVNNITINLIEFK